jgi:hypothetical protein
MKETFLVRVFLTNISSLDLTLVVKVILGRKKRENSSLSRISLFGFLSI